jgi:hypothetical protein
MSQKQLSTKSPTKPFEEIFAALPPLDSPEYLRLLNTATPEALPAQVLVRAYRQLCRAGAEAEARSTLERLIAGRYAEFYLKSIHALAKKQVMSGQYTYDADDLVQEAIRVIVETLPTERGDFAESAWVTYCRQAFAEGWRSLNGREGKKFRLRRVETKIDPKTGEEKNPMEVADDSVPWHVAMRESNVPWIEDFAQRVIAEMRDPLMRQIAADQFGDDPSPISSGRSKGGKPPLTEQLGENRFKISRVRDQARARLFAALVTQKEKEIDLDWLRKTYRGI